ncbi:4-aminobutyrate aminotransferase-like enzyme [Paenibacillus sp. SORGH_AS338]|nr:4-aminobutyrate aminotransferase-like enzyme [Paenibacillus sp. SORGH_AS_0338]
MEEVQRKGKLLGDLLLDLEEKYSCIGEARGVGLMWGLEIVDEYNAPDTNKMNAIINFAFADQQLILRGSRYGFGNVVKVRPSLTVTDEEIVEIIRRLDLVLSSLD